MIEKNSFYSGTYSSVLLKSLFPFSKIRMEINRMAIEERKHGFAHIVRRMCGCKWTEILRGAGEREIETPREKRVSE